MGPARANFGRDLKRISIHPSRVGWDPLPDPVPLDRLEFQSTHPVWDGTYAQDVLAKQGLFQSTHPVWDGTSPCGVLKRMVSISIHPSRVGWDYDYTYFTGLLSISIHPSRVGWDLTPSSTIRRASISIHPSRVGWDCACLICCARGAAFQSTHPVWDGTVLSATRRAINDISIHPSRVGWDQALVGQLGIMTISIHPSRVGWDARGRGERAHYFRISIHPSRVGWDGKKYMITYISCDSYPFCQIFRLHKMTAYSYS